MIWMPGNRGKDNCYKMRRKSKMTFSDPPYPISIFSRESRRRIRITNFKILHRIFLILLMILNNRPKSKSFLAILKIKTIRNKSRISRKLLLRNQRKRRRNSNIMASSMRRTRNLKRCLMKSLMKHWVNYWKRNIKSTNLGKPK